ncbi:cell wall-active antibiotics response protein LiaF [Virgibacillus sp. W0430]|uniref:cell wall-active antibiotics response protein LiaF n=1 Tax=Virgibacillus sp. W0430 TaxID=3391580 RepID=UPI003F488450
MFKRIDTDLINAVLIVGVILFVVEIVFFNGGLIFTALFSGLLIYIGWKNFIQLWGKVCFWIGTITILFSILNMMAVRLFVLVGIGFVVIHYFKSKNETEKLTPMLADPENQAEEEETIYSIDPLFDKHFFRDQKTSDTPYSWRDVHIHGVYGDRTIDLSNTVLPNDTAVISIRHLIGNIIIYVPYEVEISIHHSSVFGRAIILNHEHRKLLNQTLFYQTGNYNNSNLPRVKIITSLLSGDIEVKRI